MREDRFSRDEVDFLVRFVVADDHDFGLCLVSAVRIIRIASYLALYMCLGGGWCLGGDWCLSEE